MTRAIQREYRKVRKAGLACIVGESARVSLDIAKTLVQWRELEDAGFVQIAVEPEDSPDVSYLDTWEHLSEQSKRRMIDKIEQDGVWVVFSQYRTDPDGEWETADSIGNCQGYDSPADPYDNAYVPDLMSNALDRLREALKGRFCSHCGHRA